MKTGFEKNFIKAVSKNLLVTPAARLPARQGVESAFAKASADRPAIFVFQM